eukprot:363392-Chlamydomonas_euryale.AAC.5
MGHIHKWGISTHGACPHMGHVHTGHVHACSMSMHGTSICECAGLDSLAPADHATRFGRRCPPPARHLVTVRRASPVGALLPSSAC